MNLKVRHKVGGGMSIDGHVADQLIFKEDGSLGTAHVPDLTTATDDTLVPWGLVKGLRSLPLFFRDIHFGTRESIPTVFNGTARPNDGDEVYADTHPQVVLGILNGAQVSCLESEWQADPYKRGMWSRGTAALVDGKPTGWVRMPDMNQVKAGSLPPPFVRGGSDTLVGNTEQDRIRDFGFTFNLPTTNNNLAVGGGLKILPELINTVFVSGTATTVGKLEFKASNTVPTGPENSPWALRGVSYSIIANGVMNEANINAAGLSAMLDVAYAKIADLQSDKGFTIIYPGGTVASPASISINQVVTIANPFPGYEVETRAEIKWSDGKWYTTGWNTASGSKGVAAVFLPNTDQVQAISGNAAIVDLQSWTGGGVPILTGADTAARPFRIKVWKVGKNV